MSFQLDIDGCQVGVVVDDPDQATHERSYKVYRRAYQRAVSRGLATETLAAELFAEHEAASWEHLTQLSEEIRVNEGVLTDESVSVDERRKVAERTRVARQKVKQINTELGTIKSRSAASVARQEQFDFLVATCTRYLDGSAYFRNVKEYQQLRDSHHPVAVAAHHYLAMRLFGLLPSDEYMNSLPENVFLRQYPLPS